MKEAFLESLDYDLWANQQWLPALDRFESPDGAREMFEHILAAQGRWLDRCGIHVERDPDLARWMLALNAALKNWVQEADLTQRVRIVTTTGVVNFDIGADILRHVVNHGTYHRGQLRGLAQAEGLEDFPETDFIRFTRQRSV